MLFSCLDERPVPLGPPPGGCGRYGPPSLGAFYEFTLRVARMDGGPATGYLNCSNAVWSPDGRSIACVDFLSDTGRSPNIVVDSDGLPHLAYLGLNQKLKKGEILTGTVAAITDGGVEVTIGDGVLGFIRKSELSRDRSEQRPDRFAVGERVDAKVTAIDRATRKLTLSIKAREMDEEKRAMAEFGSSDSGASLGDILGAAISRARRQGEVEEKTEEKS